MSILGQHWILDAGGCAPRVPGDARLVARALEALPRALGLTAVGEPQVSLVDGPEPAQVGLVLLSESHLALHLFPLSGRLHADLFSCRPFEPARARALLAELFAFERAREQVLERRAP